MRSRRCPRIQPAGAARRSGERRFPSLSAFAPAAVVWSLLALPLARGAQEERLGAGEPEAPEARIRWHSSFQDAMADSKTTKRPLLVDFEADWCGWCKKLDRETYTDERVIRLVREFFVAAKVDTDAHPDLAERYAVKGLPTILVLSAGGEELQRLTGFRTAEKLVEELGSAVSSAATLEELKAAAEKDPDDLDAQRAYARAVLAAGKAESAAGILRAALEKHPGDPALLLELADVLRSAGNSREARELYTKLVALVPEAGGPSAESAYLPLAAILVGAREHKRAIEVLTSYVERFPEGQALGQAYLLRGYAHAVENDAGKAVADLEAIVKLDPEGELGFKAATILDLLRPRK